MDAIVIGPGGVLLKPASPSACVQKIVNIGIPGRGHFVECKTKRGVIGASRDVRLMFCIPYQHAIRLNLTERDPVSLGPR